MVSSSFTFLSLLSLTLPSLITASPTSDLETRAAAASLPSSLQTCLKNTKAELSYPSDSSYGDYSAPENSALKASPAVIVLPKHASVAAKVVKCVADEGGKVKLSPRGGGHSYEAYSTPNGAVTLDLRKLNEVNVNKDAKTAEVGGGVRLGDLASQLADQGFALPHGTCPYVGVSGHGLGGGFGFLARDSGYLMDRIISMSVVKADGSTITASKTENPDLYWGLLGAGSNNFGTVLSFTYALVDAPTQIVNFNYVYGSNDDCANTLVALQSLTNSADPSVGFPPEFTGELLLYGAGEGDPGACSFSGQHVRATKSQHASIFSRLTKKSGIKPSSSDVTTYTTWKDSLINIMGSLDTSDVNGNHEPYYAKSLVTPADAVFTRQSATALMDKLVSYIGIEGTGNSISFEMLGPLSYTNKVPKEATSYPHRTATFISQYYSYGFPSSNNNGQQDKVFNAFQDLINTAKQSSPNSVWGAYSNYIDHKLTTWAKDYYGDSLDRLKALKKTWDPQTIFDFPRGLAHA